jgi:hypothetical protein
MIEVSFIIEVSSQGNLIFRVRIMIHLSLLYTVPNKPLSHYPGQADLDKPTRTATNYK